MKKLFAVLIVALAMVGGLFADDFPTGSWIDENWNGEWVFGVGTLELKDSVSGESICVFDKAKMQDYKLEVTTEGLAMSFYYPETERAYTFIKPATVEANLIERVNPDWEEMDYQTVINFKKPELDVPALPSLGQ